MLPLVASAQLFELVAQLSGPGECVRVTPSTVRLRREQHGLINLESQPAGRLHDHLSHALPTKRMRTANPICEPKAKGLMTFIRTTAR